MGGGRIPGCGRGCPGNIRNVVDAGPAGSMEGKEQSEKKKTGTGRFREERPPEVAQDNVTGPCCPPGSPTAILSETGRWCGWSFPGQPSSF